MTVPAAATDVLSVGIDVGGTKTALVVTDAGDRLHASQVVATDGADIVGQLAGLVSRAAGVIRPATISAVGVAAPGHVDERAGTVRLAVNLHQVELDLRGAIEDALGIPCRVEHDARAAAIWLDAEARNEGRASRGLAYLSVGTGISAGVVLDGQPLRGADGLAGEIGHLVADPDGPRCGCGLRGCLEAVASGPAIARRAAELVAAAEQATSLPARPTAEQVFESAALGDAVARRVVDETAAHLARAVRGLALAFGVERVVIGGGVARAGTALSEPLLAAIARERDESPLVDDALARATVELVAADSFAGARGAALIARRALASTGPHAAGGKGVDREQ
jgi:glucokinase